MNFSPSRAQCSAAEESAVPMTAPETCSVNLFTHPARDR